MADENSNKGSPLMSYYYTIYLYEIIMRILAGLWLIRLYSTKPMSLLGLIRFFMFYHLLRIVINGYYFATTKTTE